MSTVQPPAASYGALAERRTFRPRRVGHCATTRPSRTRCRTGRLARECRCQIIRAETCDRLAIISSFSHGNSSCAKSAE